MAEHHSIKVRIKHYKDRKNLLLYYRDPVTEKLVTRSAKTSRIRDAEREAAKWEEELAAGLTRSHSSWEAFRERYDREHLAFKSPRTRESADSIFNHLERGAAPEQTAGDHERYAQPLCWPAARRGYEGQHDCRAPGAPAGGAELGVPQGPAAQGSEVRYAHCRESLPVLLRWRNSSVCWR